ncbi:transmembrane protein, putative (macronuclear) [Tetrahymena thermophila SB210]|uniref:Transmembrane protein, putative n=1 Tax=Tetrahymena thermophila (strain SB210) TaxID=312017 RepID=W7XCR7_TETTS|nr:transmembrane protein, putative [Tetrahymena thermophila SB210]EWS75277.1 transmembrane protein, putative [Tetrahymena thermophila SB210]|eukprot:XP_012652268.1 transmembrane protein, putative [Tetrahymena thermophila SB210]
MTQNIQKLRYYFKQISDQKILFNYFNQNYLTIYIFQHFNKSKNLKKKQKQKNYYFFSNQFKILIIKKKINQIHQFVLFILQKIKLKLLNIQNLLSRKNYNYKQKQKQKIQLKKKANKSYLLIDMGNLLTFSENNLIDPDCNELDLELDQKLSDKQFQNFCQKISHIQKLNLLRLHFTNFKSAPSLQKFNRLLEEVANRLSLKQIEIFFNDDCYFHEEIIQALNQGLKNCQNINFLEINFFCDMKQLINNLFNFLKINYISIKLNVNFFKFQMKTNSINSLNINILIFLGNIIIQILIMILMSNHQAIFYHQTLIKYSLLNLAFFGQVVLDYQCHQVHAPSVQISIIYAQKLGIFYLIFNNLNCFYRKLEIFVGGIQSLSQSISNLENLKTLKLDLYVSLVDQQFKYLCEGISKCKQLYEFRYTQLEKSELTDDSIQFLSKAIVQLPNLQSLYINLIENNFGQQRIGQILGESISNSQNLTYLFINLSLNKIKQDDAEVLCNQISKSPQLYYLSIFFNKDKILERFNNKKKLCQISFKTKKLIYLSISI